MDAAAKEQQRLQEQRETLGENGLEERAVELKAAIAENERAPPQEVDGVCLNYPYAHLAVLLTCEEEGRYWNLNVQYALFSSVDTHTHAHIPILFSFFFFFGCHASAFFRSSIDVRR